MLLLTGPYETIKYGSSVSIHLYTLKYTWSGIKYLVTGAVYAFKCLLTKYLNNQTQSIKEYLPLILIFSFQTQIITLNVILSFILLLKKEQKS